MNQPREHRVEMLFAIKDPYPGPRRGEAIQRDADKAIAKAALPYPVQCVRVDFSRDPSGRAQLPYDPLIVTVVYREISNEPLASPSSPLHT